MVFVRFLMGILALAASRAEADVGVELVVSNLSNPLYATHAGDGSNRLFIVEQAGRIRILDQTTNSLLPNPFLDIRSIVGSDASERGLLGLAFDPEYRTTGQVIVNYTDLLGNTVVARYTVSADPNALDPESAEILLTQIQPFSNHNGGHVAFGPDGYLYVALGDGGLAADPLLNGQNTLTLLGTLLRIDVSGPGGYTIPNDNPHLANPLARDEIWAHGLRNPWRFSFDRDTGDLYIGDVGQNAWEEIDFEPAASGGGRNYGWNLFEGTRHFPTGAELPAALPGFVAPVAEYSHDEGCSVTGGYVYRGAAHPALVGRYVYGDFCSGRIWTLERNGDSWISTEVLDTEIGISSFGEDERGELYVTDLFAGLLWQIVD